MSNMRQERVRELLKRVIGEAIRREFNVNDVGLITITDLEVAGDLKSATVFLTVFGKADQQKRALQVLESNRAHLQSLVARAVILKYTPTLKFVLDDSIQRGNRVLEILDQLDQQDGAQSGPKPA